jgi:hypothetical protein
MSEWICTTCAVQYPESAQPPSDCPICEDPRQWVPPAGQQWTTLDDLRLRHTNRVEDVAPGLLAIHSEPKIGIDQYAYLVQTPEGNLLWDCIALLDNTAIQAIRARGGLRAIAISHPHYYSTMAQWSRQFGGVPIYIHERDRQWVQRADAPVRFWSGPHLDLFGNLRLVLCGGHFDGFQVLHWPAGDAILAGDQPQVTPDRRWVSFLWSYPNMIPLGPRAIAQIVASLAPYPYENLYGAFGRHVVGNAKQVVARSAERYLHFLRET